MKIATVRQVVSTHHEPLSSAGATSGAGASVMLGCGVSASMTEARGAFCAVSVPGRLYMGLLSPRLMSALLMGLCTPEVCYQLT